MTDKPAVQPSPLTAAYWRGATEGRLEIQRCGRCRTWIHLPEAQCPACWSADLGYEPVSGVGTIATFSVIHRSFVPGFAEACPYVIAWIDLPEQPGLRVFGNVTGCAPDDVAIGMAVEVWFEPRGQVMLPNFRVRK